MTLEKLKKEYIQYYVHITLGQKAFISVLRKFFWKPVTFYDMLYFI